MENVKRTPEDLPGLDLIDMKLAPTQGVRKKIEESRKDAPLPDQFCRGRDTRHESGAQLWGLEVRVSRNNDKTMRRQHRIEATTTDRKMKTFVDIDIYQTAAIMAKDCHYSPLPDERPYSTKRLVFVPDKVLEWITALDLRIHNDCGIIRSGVGRSTQEWNRA